MLPNSSLLHLQTCISPQRLDPPPPNCLGLAGSRTTLGGDPIRPQYYVLDIWTSAYPISSISAWSHEGTLIDFEQPPSRPSPLLSRTHFNVDDLIRGGPARDIIHKRRLVLGTLPTFPPTWSMCRRHRACRVRPCEPRPLPPQMATHRPEGSQMEMESPIPPLRPYRSAHCAQRLWT